MSGKGDKPDKASGSKMLKKARSFREDFKVLIKRRPSTSSSSSQGQTTPVKPPKIKLNRTGSMNDGSRESFHKDADIDKLQIEVNNVYRSLHYIKAVVDQDKLQIVPNTATIVLDTVMDVFTLLSNFFMNQDSTSLLSRHNKVCQSLAQFIKWADDILLHGSQALSKENAHKVISALSEGMEELTQICIDKMEDRKHSPPKSPGLNGGHSQGYADSPKRNSLPDIPLTPREKEILEQTSDLGLYDNPAVPTSHSDDSLASTLRRDSPPPKPPLPQNVDQVLPQLLRKHSQDGTDSGDAPPPLPEKENRRSHTTNMMDMVDRTAMHGQLTPNSQSPHNSLIMSGPYSDFSASSDFTSIASHSPSISPGSKSPTSSVSSGLNHSSEDLNEQRTQRASSFSRVSSDSTMMKKSSLLTTSHSECTVNQINKLTMEINRLTSDISTITRKAEDAPPPLPNKAKYSRLPSQYDNVLGIDGAGLTEVGSSVTQQGTSRTVISHSHASHTSQSSEARLSSSSTSSSQSFSGLQMQKSHTISFTHRTSSQETCSSSDTFSSTSHSSMESLPKPPPLPPKQRHIQAYMQTFGSYTQPQGLELIARRSINFYEDAWQRHQMELSHGLYPRSNTISVISDLSSESSYGGSSSPSSPRIPALPAKRKFTMQRESMMSTASSQSDTSSELPREKACSLIEAGAGATGDIYDMEQKRSSAPAGQVLVDLTTEPTEPPKQEIQKDADSDFAELNPLDDIDVSDQLIRKRPGEDGPEIRGGSTDALIVHATAAAKSEFMYQEAFLTTYRTFISSRDLIDKLLYRFKKFQHAPDNRKKTARNAFSLLIRVVDLMSCNELDEKIIQLLMELVFELLCQGELMLARILRRKIIEKCEARQHQQELAQHTTLLSSISLTSVPADLLHFKSGEIAEQMTLMDADLFQKIEIPEVLLWAKEQSEELSPNLTQFTEHFNKMSYWCRTRILLQEEAKEREKFLMKFIKIMRHLRKMSNFNSYLAILSALDSAPVRRLEWQKQNLEALREFCQLIDSSASFRAYRIALSETEPPCIPYIGLILQDLTFINIGNPDNLPDGSINFAKRWQQFHILDSMRRFRDKKCNYDFKKNHKLLTFLDNFDDYLGEEVLWQISEKIKPRGGTRKKVESEL